MRASLVFVLVFCGCATARPRSETAISLINLDQPQQLASYIHDTPVTEREALVHTLVETVVPRLEPAYEQRGDRYSIDASARGLVVLWAVAASSDRIRIGHALVEWVMRDPGPHWLGENTIEHLAALAGIDIVVAAITTPETGVAIARSLAAPHSTVIRDGVAKRVIAAIQHELADATSGEAANTRMLQWFEALNLLDRPVGNRFLVQLAARPTLEGWMRARAISRLGPATWPERRDELVRLALTSDQIDARFYALSFVVADPESAASVPDDAMRALWNLFDARRDSEQRLRAVTGAALVALDASHAIPVLVRRLTAASRASFPRAEVESWACALEHHPAPPRDQLRTLSDHAMPAVRAFALISLAVLHAQDDLASIQSHAADPGRLEAPTWERYPTVGALAIALSSHTYAPATPQDRELCQIYVGI